MIQRPIARMTRAIRIRAEMSRAPRMIVLMTSSPDMWDRAVSFSAIFSLCVESATIVCADIHSDERVIFD